VQQGSKAGARRKGRPVGVASQDGVNAAQGQLPAARRNPRRCGIPISLHSTLLFESETGLAATQRFAMLLPAGLPPSAAKAACRFE